jgi:F-type H+-transporting ATPase subunit b
MHIDWWTLGLQTVNALVLIWLLGHFLFRPVADAIAGRQKAAGALLADAKAAKAAAESERDKAVAEAARLADHRSEAFKAVEAETAAAKSALLAKAQVEADKLRAASKAEIEARRRAGALAAEDRAARLAVDIATKLFDRLPREARISAFIDGIATGLAKLPEGTRASVCADGKSIRLTAARAVTPEEAGACRKALADVLGHPVAVEISVDPALIAGIELEAPQAVVRNSFRADLIRLKSELPLPSGQPGRRRTFATERCPRGSSGSPEHEHPSPARRLALPP